MRSWSGLVFTSALCSAACGSAPPPLAPRAPEYQPDQQTKSRVRANPLEPLVVSQPSNGSVDSRHHLFRAYGAEYVGPPTDVTEAERIEWVPLGSVRDLIARGKVVNGTTLVGLLHVLSDPRREPYGSREC